MAEPTGLAPRDLQRDRAKFRLLNWLNYLSFQALSNFKQLRSGIVALFMRSFLGTFWSTFWITFFKKIA